MQSFLFWFTLTAPISIILESCFEYHVYAACLSGTKQQEDKVSNQLVEHSEARVTNIFSQELVEEKKSKARKGGIFYLNVGIFGGQKWMLMLLSVF